METDPAAAYDEFVRQHQRVLLQSVAPIAGPDAANDAVANALIHAWENWDRVAAMENPMGYLYTIARRDAMRRPRSALLPQPSDHELPRFEPRLLPALAELSEMQRQVVYLVEGFGWGLTDTARILDISVSTVRNHRSRGLARLRDLLKVATDV